MITFGLTGGIASGKSNVTKTFRANGIPMVDADEVARKVVEPGSYGLERIREEFGSEYIMDDGMLNRTRLAKLVFSDKMALIKINLIMEPLINTESVFQIQKLHSEGNQIVGYDAALICEMGNADKYRPLIVVWCPRDMQIARLMKRNQLTEPEAVARIEAQMSVDVKMKMADFVIDTSGTVEQSQFQTIKLIDVLRTINSREIHNDLP